MIDFVHLAMDVSIRANSFQQLFWKEGMTDTERRYYQHFSRGVLLRYYPDRKRFSITGKIMMLLRNTQVQNVDDIYGADIERFVDDINQYLNALLTRPLLDIRQFQVYRMDYCFNVKTAYVREYIDFMNAAFKATDGGKRINHVLLNGLHGSVYVKTKGDYERNELRNYVLNFYDKTDQLMKQKAKGQHIMAEDFEYAAEVLRLEVQCGFQFIKAFRERHKVGSTFGELFSYELAYRAIEKVYGLVLRGDEHTDFYAYATAKGRLDSGEAAKKTLYVASTHHKIVGQKYDYGVRQIKREGVYPYFFLHKSLGIDVLENPLKLIRRKMENMGVDMTWL